MDKSEKLNKLLEILKTDTVTPKEIEQFLTTVVGVIKSSKERFESISTETIREVQSALEYIENEHELMLSKVENLTQKQSDEFKSKLSEVNSILATIKQLKDGKDGRDGIDGEKGEKGDKGEDGSPDTGEDIVAKINSLELSPEFQIDASHIKNLPEPTSGGRLGSTARNLWQLNDVTLSSPTNGQVLKYNSTTGQWNNSTDTTNSPGGSDTQVQFNDGGSFGGDEGLVYNKTTRQLSLISRNEPNGVARIQMQSYDETSTVGGDYSEVIRFDMMTNSAKAALAWRDSAGSSKVWVQAHDYLYWYETVTVTSVDTSADTLTVPDRDMPTGWQVTLTTTGTLPSPLLVETYYYVRVISSNVISLYPTSSDASANTNKINLTTSGSGTIQVVPNNDYNYNRHKHWSVEVANDINEKHTRFSIPYGYDTTEISFFSANVNVQGHLFRILGTTGSNRQMIFGKRPDDSYLPGYYDESPRWSLTCNDTSESGTNVGSDFQINRFDDDGDYIAPALFIKRSNGYIGIGDSPTSPTARFHLQSSTDTFMFLGKNTTAIGNNVSVYLGEVETTGSRVYQARLSGDTVSRYSVYGDGLVEWGAGGASSRDTNLYRSAANTLKTDDNFVALTVTSGKLTADSSAGVIIEASNGTDVALFGAGGSAAVTFYDGVKLDGSTASRILSTDSSKNITALDTATYPDLTELSYVKGVTSAIQTQINTIVNAMTVIAQPDVGNSAGGADTTVYSFTVPANTIDGTRFKGIRVNLSAALSSTSETTTFKIKLNGVTCSTQSTANTSAVLTWYNFIVRSTSSTARSFGDRITTAAGASGDGNNSISGLDFTASQTFAITIASTTANRGTLSNLIVEYI